MGDQMLIEAIGSDRDALDATEATPGGDRGALGTTAGTPAGGRRISVRAALRERGMVTIEYAIGAVLVLVLVGVIIAAIQQGWFASLVKELVTFLMQQIQHALGQ